MYLALESSLPREAAAGVAGFMKAVLMVERGQIPPNLNYDRPSPHIPWDAVPIQVPTTLMDWPAGAPQIAGVSSFGLSGTNAHLVVRAYEPAVTGCPERHAEMPGGVQGIKFSSMQPVGLKAEAESLLNYMESNRTAASSYPRSATTSQPCELVTGPAAGPV